MQRRSLRLRLILSFGFGALVLTTVLSSTIYVGVRHVLQTEQNATDLRQAFDTASIIRSTLSTAPLTLNQQVSAIEKDSGSIVVLITNGQTIGPTTTYPPYLLTPDVMTTVSGIAAVTQTKLSEGAPWYVVGIPVPAVATQVYELFPLTQVANSLHSLVVLLIVASLLASIMGFAGGAFVSFRTVRPLRQVAEAAGRILEGDLSARVPEFGTGLEVSRLGSTFNAMVQQLADRLERDARFASDVTHELRSPLTGLAMAASMLEREKESLSPAGQESLGIVVADLTIFRNLVEDLLEMARIDAGAADYALEDVRAVKLVQRCVTASTRRLDSREPVLSIAEGLDEVLITVDRRRFERVIANLFDNATKYADGITHIAMKRDGDTFVLDIDDSGAGIAVDQRDAIFERFYRGSAAHDRGSVQGTGIGLALVREHLSAIGGSIEALEAPSGGARFRLTLPLATESA